MKYLKRLLDFYLDASVHVSLAVFVLSIVTAIQLNIKPDYPLAFCLFFGCIFGYNFVKYASMADHYIFLKEKYIRQIQYFSALCFLGALYFVRFFRWETIYWTGVLMLLVVLYVVPLSARFANLRNLKGIKIYVVALSWAIATVILPVVNTQNPVTSAVWIEAFQRFLLVLALIIPFEIRDMQYDNPDLKTLPQEIGVRGSKIMGTVILLLFIVPDLYGFFYSGSEKLFGSLPVALITLLLLWNTREGQSGYYTSVLVESVPIFWFLILTFF
ncbi:hypothetical protein [Robertkochia solimangrovi]|uniref:hypothetical protein n=1 Tax=Robertkochia solimangrovi TaxID=2213046 RepID=UPI00117F54AA|nr:hypothetical protein [Robertkochia solimangrovi]TRZ44262.1 hypothetical protein DMZ48_07035 [Robertkochia solimangrovi]